MTTQFIEDRELRFKSFVNDITSLISIGKSKIICAHHTLIVKNNNHGTYYCSRNGYGTGKDTFKSMILEETVRHIFECGSQNILNTK